MSNAKLRFLSCALLLGAIMSACATGGSPVGLNTIGEIRRNDDRINALLPAHAKLEIAAYGFEWTEGPCWVKDGGYLLFSDIPPNTVFKYEPGKGVSKFLTPSGYTGSKPRGKSGDEPGSNGLIIDPKGNLVLCQHGDRRVARMKAPLSAPAPGFETISGKWQGKRHNSPNDGVYHSSGALYFTDPPYGLEKRMSDPAKELDFQGVYRIVPGGETQLLVKNIHRPNGIGLSPDEKKLYVASSYPQKAVWMVYDVKADGTVDAEGGKVFFDATKWVGKEKGLPDGMAIDTKGNLYATGPGGVLIFAPDGSHLGTLWTGEATSNCAFGDDGSTLYITADMYILRIRTTAKGLGF